MRRPDLAALAATEQAIYTGKVAGPGSPFSEVLQLLQKTYHPFSEFDFVAAENVVIAAGVTGEIRRRQGEIGDGRLSNVNAVALVCVQMLGSLARSNPEQVLNINEGLVEEVGRRASAAAVVKLVSNPRGAVVYVKPLDTAEGSQKVPDPTETLITLRHGSYRFVCELTGGKKITKDESISGQYDEVDFSE